MANVMACGASIPRAEQRKARNRDPRFVCPCSEAVTLINLYRYEICKICFREDEHTHSGIEPAAANHSLTLAGARRNFHRIGARDPETLPHVLPKETRADFVHLPRQS